MCKIRAIYGFLNTSWVLINMAPRNGGRREEEGRLLSMDWECHIHAKYNSKS